MKKNVLAFAALTLVSGLAVAQSSVTLFGVMDVSIRNLKGAGSATLMASDGRTSSRLGVRGVEDLGGGLKAGIWLEAGLAPDTGAAGDPFWGRRSTISLIGGFGELRIGRHKLSDRTIIDDFDPFGSLGVGQLVATYSSLTGGYVDRTSNQVAYHLPSMGGVYGSFDLTAGEGTDANKAVSGRIGYKAGPLHLSGSYGQHGTGNKLKTATLAGAYAFGPLNLSLMHTESERGAADQKVTSLGAIWAIGQGKLIGSIGKASGNAAASAKLYAIGYDYSLSKRTGIYTTFARIDNDAGARFAVGGTRSAAPNPERPVLGGNSTGYEVGLRHSF